MVFYGDSTASSLYIIGVKINDNRLFFSKTTGLSTVKP